MGNLALVASSRCTIIFYFFPYFLLIFSESSCLDWFVAFRHYRKLLVFGTSAPVIINRHEFFYIKCAHPLASAQHFGVSNPVSPNLYQLSVASIGRIQSIELYHSPHLFAPQEIKESSLRQLCIIGIRSLSSIICFGTLPYDSSWSIPMTSRTSSYPALLLKSVLHNKFWCLT